MLNVTGDFRILHVCGGDPKPRLCKRLLHWYSPRMWRWSLCNDLGLFNGGSILHVCGGDPDYINKRMKQIEYSPRMWRWSPDPSCNSSTWTVFSTYVEVILSSSGTSLCSCCILHVCGGDPCFKPFKPAIWWYSPRMWRWSLEWQIHKRLKNVFSTYVEVILWQWHYILGSLGILHTCWECYCPWAHR